MDESMPASPGAAARAAGDAAGYGLRFLRKHAWRMVLWFACLLLPLWSFAALVGEVHEKKVFPFDAPILTMLHAVATPTLDHFFVLMSRLGYSRGVVPLDVILWCSSEFYCGAFATVCSLVLQSSDRECSTLSPKTISRACAPICGFRSHRRLPTASRVAMRWAPPRSASR